MRKFYTLLILLLAFTGSASAFDWDQKTDFGGVARHRTTALAIYNKVYFGLGHYNGAGPNILFDDWWEYDPSTNAWTQKANYIGGLMYHATGFSIDGIGYVGTGRNNSAQVVNSFYAYDPSTNTWTQKSNFPGSGRRGAVGFAIDGFGYLGTGSYTADFYKYNPTNDTWTAVAGMPTGGRISAVGFELNGYGYVGTGDVGGPSSDFWRYDPASNQWMQIANAGTTPRMESSGFSLLGKGYILTGDNYSSGTNYGDMWEYDPSTNTWIQLEDFPGNARRYLSCVTLGNIAYAGMGTNGTNFKDFWSYDPVAGLLKKQLDQLEIITYPNPATDIVHFSIGGLENIPLNDVSICLVSLTGQKVQSMSLESAETTMDVQNLEAGIYIYEFSYRNEVLRSGKIIIQ